MDDDLKNEIISKSAEINIDPSLFLDKSASIAEYTYPKIWSNYSKSNIFLANEDLFFPYDSRRFDSEIKIWKSVPKEELNSHWTSNVCSANSNYFPMYIEEYCGEKDLLSINFSDLEVTESNNDLILNSVKNHDVVLSVDGEASIIRSVVSSEYVNCDARVYTKSRIEISPFSGSPTIHEMFKLLLEWQWDFVENKNQETMAKVSNSYLNKLGLNYSDTENLVISSILSLPDQQLMQFRKNNFFEIPEEDPECPESFIDWTQKLMYVINLSIEYLN